MPHIATTAHVATLRTETQRGASAVEYALLAAFIAAVIVAAVTAFGVRVDELFGIDLSTGS